MTRELIIQLQDGSTQAFPLDRNRVTLGRSGDNDLPYPDDPVLSRRHLAIDFDGEEWWVEDLGSKNGTVVNGQRLSERYRLRVGDRIIVGRVSLLFDDPTRSTDKTVVFIPDESDITARAASVSTNLEQVLGSEHGLEGALKSPAIAATPKSMQALLAAGRELDGNRPLPELFKVILDLAVNAVGATRGVVMTFEGGVLSPRAARGDNFRISSAVRDRVLNQRESLLIVDASQDAALRASMTIVQQKVKSLLAAPLQTKEQVLGLIYIDSPEVIRPFSAEDLTLLTVMANVAAMRIENARLGEEEARSKTMRKELEQAAEIQRNLLPKGSPQADGFDIAGMSVACRSVGGDYYDYLKLRDGKVGIICGDVAGKGMPAALLMSSVQARVQVLSEEDADVATLMTRLNRSVASNCPGNRFITFFLAVADPETGRVSYCNAGHNPPYLVRADGSVETLDVGGPVLGILKHIGYQSATVELKSGDMVMMFSDGVTEARSPSDDEYGEDRLIAELVARRKQPANEVVQGVYRALERFMADAPVADDITLVAVRRI